MYRNMKINFLASLLVVTICTHAHTSSEETNQQTPLKKDKKAQDSAMTYPNLVNLYRPSYILPSYQTKAPYSAIYNKQTPLNQIPKEQEFKAYFSFVIPLLREKKSDKPLSFNFSYSQLMYWQLYTKSPYFREINYEPELFVEKYFSPHVVMQVGINHVSNGRGGELERSWNRIFAQMKFSGDNWLVQMRGWVPVAQQSSSDLHNPDIAHYLGYENMLISWKWQDITTSVEVQNLASGLKRGFVQASISYPLLDKVSAFGQFFNGYGQSLIEYNHKNTGLGIGLALNNWIN